MHDRLPRVPRATASARFRRVLSCSALLAGLSSCLGSAAAPQADVRQYYAGQPAQVLDVAAELLRRQGYKVGVFDGTFLELEAERSEVTRRPEGSLVAGTLVTQQVVIDGSEDGDGTQLSALFTVVWQRPTGERRIWVPESPLSRRLRDSFYSELHREIGDKP